MISLIVGGESGDKRVEFLWPQNKRPRMITVTEKGSFNRFCRLALGSTQRIIKINRKGELTSDEVSNDDFAVHFPRSYLEACLEEGITLLKLATAIETAQDLDLDVEVLSVSEDVDKLVNFGWPKHWPKRTKVLF